MPMAPIAPFSHGSAQIDAGTKWVELKHLPDQYQLFFTM
jgi:hypothetical protein